MNKDDTDRASLLERAASRLARSAPPGGAPLPPRVAPPQDAPSAAAARGTGPRTAPREDASPAHDGPSVTIDIPHLRSLGYLTPDGERTRVAEEFRIIKRPLLENAFGRAAALVEHGNLIVVTSSVPGEGKTYTAMNLAMSIAMERDKTVLLIDADAGRARVHELLNIPMGPGLIDVLLDASLDVGDVILQTNIPKLRVIPIGQLHAHSTELLASDNMHRLTHELETRYNDRVVIFDAPPLLATSDSAVLCGIAGQIVFVVEAGRTSQRQVRDALSVIDQSKPIGLVLNQLRKPADSGHYGYGSYGAGYYQTGT